MLLALLVGLIGSSNFMYNKYADDLFLTVCFVDECAQVNIAIERPIKFNFLEI
jgi:hypothetical protein